MAPLFEQQVHPGLREAYPGLADAKSKILIDPMARERAWFEPGLVGFEVPISGLLKHYGIHELQHMIDYLEKLPRGGSTAEFTRRGLSLAEAKDQYNRLVGEVVARNAQFRWRQDEKYPATLAHEHGRIHGHD